LNKETKTNEINSFDAKIVFELLHKSVLQHLVVFVKIPSVVLSPTVQFVAQFVLVTPSDVDILNK
jgi:hypothetical protein